jgi:hypothetical protein
MAATATQILPLGRKDRNVLSRLVADEMASAGEGLGDRPFGPEASLRARIVGGLIPLRSVLGWQKKVTRKEAKANNLKWEVPAVDLADALALLLDEGRGHHLAAVAAVEEAGANRDLTGESIARERLARVNTDLECLVGLQGELQAIGVEVDTLGRGSFAASEEES